MRSVIHEPRIVAGIALMVIATSAGGLLLQQSARRATVWQVAHSLTAGTVLTAGDVHLRQVALEGWEEVYAGAGQVVVGRALARDVGRGELLAVAALATTEEARREVSVPVEQSHSVGELRRGERVDVWWSELGSDGRAARSVRVLGAVRVGAVRSTDVGASTAVVLVVEPDEVPVLVQALRSGVLDLVRVGGAA